MRILGIETSCDECSISVVEDGCKVISLVTQTQLKDHRKFGGVVPELASRMHAKNIYAVFQQLLAQSMQEVRQAPYSNHNAKLNVVKSAQYNSQQNIQNSNSATESTFSFADYIEGIAVSVCPGLSGSLMVGLQFAKGLALSLNKPLIGIDHILAHFYSGQLQEDLVYPYIGVVVSGGHSLIGLVHSYDTVEIKGASIDDACGEAFEKIARELDLGYPGGPSIDALAKKGNVEAAAFPIYSVKKYGYNFSYSGLKTAVIHHRDKYWNTNYPQSREHIAAAFQKAAIAMIIERVQKLVDETGIDRVVLGGGVACNSYFAEEISKLALTQLVIPEAKYCADNGAMIAGLGYQYLIRGIASDLDIGINARNYAYRAYSKKAYTAVY